MASEEAERLGLGEDWGDDDDGASSSSGESEAAPASASSGAPGANPARQGSASDSSSDEDDEDGDRPARGGSFPLHDAAERGDVEAVRVLAKQHLENPAYLQRKAQIEAMPEEEAARRELMLAAWSKDHRRRLFERRDHESCTPLQVAVLWRQLEVLRALVEVGSTVAPLCNGSPITHLILGVGSIRAHREFALAALAMVLAPRPNAQPTDVVELAARDDLRRSVLHLAAEFDFCASIAVLESHGGDVEALWKLKDLEGRTAVHVACRVGSTAVLQAALASELGREAACLPDLCGLTALHVAAGNDFTAGIELLVAALPSLKGSLDARGRTAVDWARANGSAKALAALGEPSAATNEDKRKTLVLSHEICSQHYTCNPRFTSRRGMFDVPPENVNRLKVLLDDDLGILRSARLEGRLDWQKATRANIADVLRVHDFSYVDKLQKFTRQLEANEIGELDGDTSISGLSFEAAMFAAGSVCDAIDSVCNGAHRNAFCAVRPPGHHAGPRGVVTCKNDPNGSYGFCLLSNAAIGAAYARHVYRHQGVKKVAIIDFDVHHGNGTEACVKNLLPTTVKSGFEAAFCDVTLSAPSYKPWLNEQDHENVLFASIHGYGKRMPGLDPDPFAAPRIGMFYPSDGANFGFGEFDQAGAGQPKIIDVGQNSKSRMEWRSSWRKHVLPAVAEFSPDLIIISAGFDAHKEDDINMGYISALEHDYYWLTRQLVKIANRCSKGRLVSVLEGGYKIQGQIVSPFARSVCSHVAALTESNDAEQYDAEDAVWEESHEQALLERARVAAAKLQQQAAGADDGGAGPAAADDSDAAKNSGAGDDDEEMAVLAQDESEPVRKRARREASRNVDYKALNDQLNAELAEARRKEAQGQSSSSSSAPAGPATDGA